MQTQHCPSDSVTARQTALPAKPKHQQTNTDGFLVLNRSGGHLYGHGTIMPNRQYGPTLSPSIVLFRRRGVCLACTKKKKSQTEIHLCCLVELPPRTPAACAAAGKTPIPFLHGLDRALNHQIHHPLRQWDPSREQATITEEGSKQGKRPCRGHEQEHPHAHTHGGALSLQHCNKIK